VTPLTKLPQPTELSRNPRQPRTTTTTTAANKTIAANTANPAPTTPTTPTTKAAEATPQKPKKAQPQPPIFDLVTREVDMPDIVFLTPKKGTKRTRVESPQKQDDNNTTGPGFVPMPPQKSTSLASKELVDEALALVKRAADLNPKYLPLMRALIHEAEAATSATASIASTADTTNTTNTAETLYSDVVKKNTKITKPTQQQHPQPNVTPKPETKQVVVITEGQAQVNPLQVRNNINRSLKSTVVTAVKTTEKGNVVLYCTTKPEVLISQFPKWKEAIPAAKQAVKPGAWVKLVAHGVPYHPQDCDISEIFKSEVETFNPVKVKGRWNYLKKPTEASRHVSIAFAVETEDEAKYIRKNGLYVAGVHCKIANFRAFGPRTQCFQCQGYGHNPRTCHKPQRCRLCADDHFTWDHECGTCKATKLCEHVKCVNCSGHHPSDYKGCEVYKTIINE
jgi:hypothetical protein